LLEDLLTTSNARENTLSNALSAAKTATVNAAVAVTDAGDAKDDADAAVTSAEDHLEGVKEDEAAKIATAEGVLSNKEAAATEAQTNVDLKKAEHTAKVGEQQHAQNAYDGAKPSLDGEQATLTDVILLLKGLQATNDYTLQFQTGTNSYCDGGRITVKFKVDGLWTEKLEFSAGANKGDIKEKIFSLASKPSALEIFAEDNDAWCYVDGTITKGHEESSVTFLEYGGADGPDYNSNGFGSWWTDGDEEAPRSNEYQINWGASDWETGWCNNESGQDSNNHQHVLSGKWTQSQCLTKCNQDVDAQGCEWHTSEVCSTHHTAISGGSGSEGYVCMAM